MVGKRLATRFHIVNFMPTLRQNDHKLTFIQNMQLMKGWQMVGASILECQSIANDGMSTNVQPQNVIVIDFKIDVSPVDASQME